MDANKLKVLQDIDYTIRAVCGNCANFIGAWKAIKNGFGTCVLGDYTYQHNKHTGQKRELSVHFSGSCDRHKYTEDIRLHAFEQFKE